MCWIWFSNIFSVWVYSFGWSFTQVAYTTVALTHTSISKICRIYHIKLLMYDILKVWFSQGQWRMDMWSFRCLHSPWHATDLVTWIFSRFTYRGNETKSWSWGDSFSFPPQFHILLDELLPWNWSRWFTSVNSMFSTFWFKINTINYS